jgi:hypothetical protein
VGSSAISRYEFEKSFRWPRTSSGPRMIKEKIPVVNRKICALGCSSHLSEKNEAGRPCAINTRPTLDPQPCLERMKIMAKHSSATCARNTSPQRSHQTTRSGPYQQQFHRYNTSPAWLRTGNRRPCASKSATSSKRRGTDHRRQRLSANR